MPSHTIHPIPSTSAGCAGSIRWGIDHVRCFEVRAPYNLTYGHTATDADDHREAAQIALWRGADYCRWVPNGTVLTVWRVGPKYDYMRSDKKEYRVFAGEIFPLDTCVVDDILHAFEGGL